MIYPRVSLFAMMLASAGIPLYIHLPQFAAVELGIGLGALGGILLAIRLVDLVQDPLIGWIVDRWPGAQLKFAMLAAGGLALGFPLLFSLTPGPGVILQLVLVLIGLFTAYSLGMILLYGRSATLAARAEPRELLTLAGFREGGMLGGVLLAAIAPAVLVRLGAPGQGYAVFGFVLGGFALAAAVLTRPVWTRPAVTGQPLSVVALARAGALRLLVLALLNSLPVALTSTLFLFFADDRLNLAGYAGGLLVLFFLAAGLSVPFWAWLSRRAGPKQTLLIAMPLAIASFAGAAFLGPGSLPGFALICAASGAALGADMVLLPAMFSIALTKAGLNASTAFGIWSFAGKLALALAAALALPLLEHHGFRPGADNSRQALGALNLAYAVLPCVLKTAAFAFALTLPEERPAA
ncbi:MFS transporter [Leisingera methylohalidivorans]|uniref:Sodium:galactoside symporter n=1 Tax=Leisingera methylohalidivorans DSM 14336 TaxID=999552 RepID=V9VXI6_9RHOB|nr:MFS transporter [Leisingera methylohalidivorans]AHD02090.1 sodium:galactoside symporter [Leisingera methylohalidivorans DSM 14336]